MSGLLYTVKFMFYLLENKSARQGAKSHFLSQKTSVCGSKTASFVQLLTVYF